MHNEDNAASCYFWSLKKAFQVFLEHAQEPVLRIAVISCEVYKVLGGKTREKMALTEPLRTAIENIWENSPNS